MVNRERDYAVVLGRRGGKARAKKLTAEERSSSASAAAKKRWSMHRPLGLLRSSIENLRSGDLTVTKAQLLRDVHRLQLRIAELSQTAEAAGITSDFVNQYVEAESVMEFRALLKEFGALINERKRRAKKTA
jgi:hypothetical protein